MVLAEPDALVGPERAVIVHAHAVAAAAGVHLSSVRALLAALPPGGVHLQVHVLPAREPRTIHIARDNTTAIGTHSSVSSAKLRVQTKHMPPPPPPPRTEERSARPPPRKVARTAAAPARQQIRVDDMRTCLQHAAAPCRCATCERVRAQLHTASDDDANAVLRAARPSLGLSLAVLQRAEPRAPTASLVLRIVDDLGSTTAPDGPVAAAAQAKTAAPRRTVKDMLGDGGELPDLEDMCDARAHHALLPPCMQTLMREDRRTRRDGGLHHMHRVTLARMLLDVGYTPAAIHEWMMRHGRPPDKSSEVRAECNAPRTLRSSTDADGAQPRSTCARRCDGYIAYPVEAPQRGAAGGRTVQRGCPLALAGAQPNALLAAIQQDTPVPTAAVGRVLHAAVDAGPSAACTQLLRERLAHYYATTRAITQLDTPSGFVARAFAAIMEQQELG